MRRLGQQEIPKVAAARKRMKLLRSRVEKELSISAPKMNRLHALMRAQMDCLTELVAVLEEWSSALERTKQDLERFAFMARHDIQEPLRVISTAAQLLAKKRAGLLDQDAVMLAGNIVDGVARVQDLLAGLLAHTDLATHPEAPADAVDVTARSRL